MRNIYLTISSISLALLLSACGGGSGGTSVGDGDSPSSSPSGGSSGGSSGGGSSSTEIQVTSCETYIALLSGDTLVKETDDTVVTIRDNADNTQDVCVNTGAAHILR